MKKKENLRNKIESFDLIARGWGLNRQNWTIWTFWTKLDILDKIDILGKIGHFG